MPRNMMRSLFRQDYGVILGILSMSLLIDEDGNGIMADDKLPR